MTTTTPASPIAIPPSRSSSGHESFNVNPVSLRLQTRRGSRSAPDPWSLGPLSSSASATGSALDTSVTGGYGPGTFTHGGGGSGGPSPSTSTLYTNVANANNQVPRSSTASRITIVRVHQQDSSPGGTPITNEDHSVYQPYTTDGSSLGGAPAATGAAYAQQQANSRPGRSSSWGSAHSNASAASTGGPASTGGRSHSPGASRRPGGRMTFAFSSFTPIVPPSPSPGGERSTQSPAGDKDGGASSRPNSSGGRMHHRTYSSSNMQPIKPSLTAQQIYELAMTSTSASAAAGGASGSPQGFGEGINSANSTAPASPVISSSASYQHYRSRSQSRPTTPGLTSAGAGEKVSPAVFRPMPDEVYLPFIDRPSEVTALLAEPPTSGLFLLLEALFPTDMKKGALPKDGDEHEEDPAKWTFDHLSRHLKETTRAEMNDVAWTDAARACIQSRSEALWERFKGALGVPAELEDANEDDEEALDDNTGMMSGSFLEDVKSQVANAAVVGSDYHLPESEAGVGVHFSREAILQPVFADQGDSDEEEEEEDDDEQNEGGPTSAGGVGNLPNHSSGALSDGGWSSGRVMENIGEGPEEEDEDEAEEEGDTAAQIRPTGSPSEMDSSKSKQAEFDYSLSSYLSPTREIRALQITTAPSTSGASAAGGNARSPYEELAAFVHSPASLHRQDSVGRRASPAAGEEGVQHVQRSSTGAATKGSSNDTEVGKPAESTPPAATPTDTNNQDSAKTSSPPSARSSGGPRVVLRRPSETIGQTLAEADKKRSGSEAGSYEGFGGYGLAPSNRPYHPALSERGPGNPLFPSSFADLSVAPTLVANVPKVSRSASTSYASHYPSSLAPGRRNVSGSPAGGEGSLNAPSSSPLRRNKSLGARAPMNNTWAHVRDRYEYAVTVASASSDGGRG